MGQVRGDRGLGKGWAVASAPAAPQTFTTSIGSPIGMAVGWMTLLVSAVGFQLDKDESVMMTQQVGLAELECGAVLLDWFGLIPTSPSPWQCIGPTVTGAALREGRTTE